MTMPIGIAVVTAVASGSAALALGPWTRTLADTASMWLRSWVAVLFATLGGLGAAAVAVSFAELAAFALLGLACAVLIVVDLAALRLPNIIIGPMYPMLFVALSVAAVAGHDWARLGRAAAAAGLLLVTYMLMAFASPSNLGLGDVKLSGLLGAFLGWLGWGHVLLGTLAAFTLAGLVALILVILFRAKRRTDFAFGPWMVAGAAIGAAFGPLVLVPGG